MGESNFAGITGLSTRAIGTPRLRTVYLESDPGDGRPVVFVHGDVSSSRWVSGHRTGSPGFRRFGDEASGCDVGGGVAMWYAMEYQQAVGGIPPINPMSPHGLGGTKDASGTPCYPDFAGSGGGTANPEFVKRLAGGDRSAEDPNSPATS
ncbi:hypothetical protein [Rubrobacter indicoceani]|uniref:hypothetical protein n=1 Tax=Rubrobacter indicoceani TaxID=2051957 RepID=UPI001968E556|nr:hypothetical protein [Rubrobacter indicoceani]